MKVALVVALLGTLSLCAADDLTVTIPGLGTAKGMHANGARVWLGLPHSAPPVNDLRWRPPQPPAPWTGVLDATAYKPNCAQSTRFSPPMGRTSEDCLYVNVFTPNSSVQAPPGGFPVAVWLHGGGYTGGGPNEVRLNGTFNARDHNVVLVVVAYRLGPFGYLGDDSLRSRDPKGSTGNYGLLDQRAAMAWTQKYISAFGGNPDSLLIYGESAGAGSVACHAASPRSWPYMQSIAMESGAFSPWISNSLDTASANYKNLLTAVDCTDVDCLLGKSTETILKATVGPGNVTDDAKAGSVGLGAVLQLPWAPTVDGVELTDAPQTLLAQGKFVKVPAIAGSVRDEGSSFIGVAHNLNEAGYIESLTTVAHFAGGDVATLQSLYPPSSYPSNVTGITSYYWAAEHALGDFLMTCPARRTVRAYSAAGLDAYLFLFARAPVGSPFVYHSADIPYVFNSLSLLPTPDDRVVGKLASTAWMNFAQTSSPNKPTPLSIDWPPHSASQNVSLRINVSPEVQDNLRGAGCDYWDSLL